MRKGIKGMIFVLNLKSYKFELLKDVKSIIFILTFNKTIHFNVRLANKWEDGGWSGGKEFC